VEGLTTDDACASPLPFAGISRIRFNGFLCMDQRISARLARHPRDVKGIIGRMGGVERGNPEVISE
jgi:hypothetical protein